jgi:hypothetical protein
MPTLQHILEALKLAPRYLAATGLFCGLILLLPESLANDLGVRDFAQNYRQWIGIAFIAILALLAVDGCVKISGTIRNRARLAKTHKRILKRLHSLTEEEKQILRFYLATESKTNVLRIDDGIVNGLVSYGIIHLSSRQGNIIEGFAHNISEFAWEYLHEHYELLEGTTNTYRTDKRENSRW